MTLSLPSILILPDKEEGTKGNSECFRVHLVSQLTKLRAVIGMSLLVVNTDSQLAKVQEKKMPGCSPLESKHIYIMPSVQGSENPIEEGMEKLTARDGDSSYEAGSSSYNRAGALVSLEQLQLPIREASSLVKELLVADGSWEREGQFSSGV